MKPLPTHRVLLRIAQFDMPRRTRLSIALSFLNERRRRWLRRAARQVGRHLPTRRNNP